MPHLDLAFFNALGNLRCELQESQQIADAGARAANGFCRLLMRQREFVDQPLQRARLFQGIQVLTLDVFDQEPLPLDSPLRSLPNVHLLPHVAGASTQTVLRQGRLIVEELSRFFSGQPLQYPVTLQMLQTMA